MIGRLGLYNRATLVPRFARLMVRRLVDCPADRYGQRIGQLGQEPSVGGAYRRHEGGHLMTAPTTAALTSPTSARLARRTGIAYLGIVVCGLFAELFVRGSLVVPGDAAATGELIAGAPVFFSVGIAADTLMIALDVAVAFGLYRLLGPVNRQLALAATALRLVQASILALNLANPVRALRLALDGDGALALQAMQTHALVYDVGLIAFGLACLTLGSVLRQGGAPRVFAVGLGLTGVVYLLGSFATLFAASWSALIEPLYMIAIIVEPAFAIWLIRRGSGSRDTAAALRPSAPLAG